MAHRSLDTGKRLKFMKHRLLITLCLNPMTRSDLHQFNQGNYAGECPFKSMEKLQRGGFVEVRVEKNSRYNKYQTWYYATRRGKLWLTKYLHSLD